MQNKALAVGARNNFVSEKIQSEFEKVVKLSTSYSKNPQFQSQVTLCIQKMDYLIEAITNVNLSLERYPSNDLCFGSSLSQLIEVLFEIKFPVDKMIPTVDSLKHINRKLDNTVEIACLHERMINAFDSMNEEERKKVGEKRIFYDIFISQI